MVPWLLVWEFGIQDVIQNVILASCTRKGPAMSLSQKRKPRKYQIAPPWRSFWFTNAKASILNRRCCLPTLASPARKIRRSTYLHSGRKRFHCKKSSAFFCSQLPVRLKTKNLSDCIKNSNYCNNLPDF